MQVDLRRVMVRGTHEFAADSALQASLMAPDGRESNCNARDPSSILGSERPSREGHGNPLQYCCLENPMDKGAWYGPRGGKESDTAEQLTLSL